MGVEGTADHAPEVSEARGRTPSRLWLVAPLLLAALAAAAWSGWWLLARSRLEAALDEAARAHQQQGRALTWESRRVGGFPFRMNVRFERLRFASPSGWGLEAPRLNAEANAYQLTRWVAVAPEGLTLTRPQAGPVKIDARVLRASLTGADQVPPRIAVEGVDVRFTTVAGAEPFLLSAAQRLELHLRPIAARPEDATLVLRLKQVAPRPGGLVGLVSAGRPGDFIWESVVTDFARLQGRDWESAVRTWTEAGGRMEVTQASFKAGEVAASTRNAALSAGHDGRLRGRLDLQLSRPLQALAALGQGADPGAIGAATAVAQARGANASLPLVFEAGVMTIGPVSLGDAPRVY